MDAVLLRLTIKACLDSVDQCVARLCAAIRLTGDLAAVVAHHEHGGGETAREGRDGRALATRAFSRLDFHDKQEENRVVRYVGAVACTEKALEAARELNTHKRELTRLIGLYRSLASTRERDGRHVRSLLTDLGHARLNLIQAYRQVPICEAQPRRIGFTWVLGTTRVRHTTGTGALVRVIPADEQPPTEYRRARRVLRSADEQDLREVEPIAAHVRANISFPSQSGRPSVCIHAPLPILYLHDPRAEPTKIIGADKQEPSSKDRARRKRRSDSRLRPVAGTRGIHRLGSPSR